MITFRNVHVVGSPPDEAPLDVTVAGGRVTTMSPSGHAAPPGRTIEASGRWLGPGLVDGHVHFPETADEIADLIALDYLAAGVTSVFCMHGTATATALRQRIEAGQCAGPRLTSTGPQQNDPRMTRAQGLSVAGQHQAAGHDAIKVYSRLSADGFDGIMQGAAEAGLPVVGHVVASVGLRETLRAPQAHIAHLEELVYGFLGLTVADLADSPPAGTDERALDELAAELVARNVSLGTTIEAISSAAAQVIDLRSWLADPYLADVPEPVKAEWRPPANRYARCFDAVADGPAFQRIVRLVAELALALHRRGVRLIAGTDALHTGVPHATSLVRELADLVSAGLTPAEAFGTCVAPPLARAAAPVAIEVGHAGDLVLFGGDPSVDVTHAGEVHGVLLGDEYFTATELLRRQTECRAHPGDRTTASNDEKAEMEQR